MVGFGPIGLNGLSLLSSPLSSLVIRKNPKYKANIERRLVIINKTNVDKYLYTQRSGDPEIIVRTGGMKRLSDFILWQSSYSEIFFVEKMWPDFKSSDLNRVLLKFKKIKRNFGKNE